LKEGASSFTIVKAFSWFGHGQSLDDDQSVKEPSWLGDLGLSMRSSRTVASGRLEIEGHAASYRVVRSHVVRGRRPRVDMLMAVLVVDCKDPGWIHTAVWTVPDAHPDEEPRGEAAVGTPADPQELARMAGHFELCTPGGHAS